MRWWVPLLLLGACDDDGDDAAVDAVAPDAAVAVDAGAEVDAGDPLVRYTEERAPCADRNPERNLYWGDLHIHTALSFDAYAFDVRTRPEGTYRFAQGEALKMPPLDAAGEGTQTVQLGRPLDFAAVTDHAEFLAEIEACTTPGAPGYDAEVCVTYRAGGLDSVVAFGTRLSSPAPQRIPELCGDAIPDCPAAVAGVWARIGDAAEAAYDRTAACGFTTFVAYEYSSASSLTNLHRNVVFRNATVPDVPLSYFDEPSVDGLHTWLDAACNDAGTGCEVLAIPHNSNWGNGALFALPALAGDALAEWAARRTRLEPLVEMVQHKGDSECHNGVAAAVGFADEFCAFEKLRPEFNNDCGEAVGSGGVIGAGCVSPYDYVRNVLKRGLRVWRQVGVDPFALGFIASTDTHNGTAGDVAERGWKGHWGINEAGPEGRLATGLLTPGGILNNPGGLAAVWAVENSRDALFEAMQRRETFGTSGPRMAVRFFGSRGFDAGLCDAPDLVARGYAEGVPMGGELPAGDAAPTFVVSALRDPQGAPLQRIQIVKAWVDADDQPAERVYEVAGDPDNGAGVDADTCEPTGAGADTLCAVWTDPDFDPAVAAVYYARVLENPVCRWSAWECLSLPAADRPATCSDGTVPTTIQERAWTSPVWHRP